MDKKLKVYLNYDAETKEYSIIPQELEAHHIYAFGADVTDTIEELITLIDDVQFFEYNNDDVETDSQEIIGLLLEIIPQCKVSDEDKRYIDTVNLMMRQHFGQKDKAGKDYSVRRTKPGKTITFTQQESVHGWISSKIK